MEFRATPVVLLGGAPGSAKEKVDTITADAHG